jgi:hypothetical protein
MKYAVIVMSNWRSDPRAHMLFEAATWKEVLDHVYYWTETAWAIYTITVIDLEDR